MGFATYDFIYSFLLAISLSNISGLCHNALHTFHCFALPLLQYVCYGSSPVHSLVASYISSI